MKGSGPNNSPDFYLIKYWKNKGFLNVNMTIIKKKHGVNIKSQIVGINE